MYAKVNGKEVIRYPYAIRDLYSENPNVSFPANLTDNALLEYGIVRIVATGRPDHDNFTQSVDEISPAFNDARNRWEQQWAIRSATDVEISERKESLKNNFIIQTKRRLDGFAQSRGYDNILSACTYSASLIQKFSVEGQYCVSQRDATWAKLFEIIGEIETGARPIPKSFQDIEPELPVLAWPN